MADIQDLFGSDAESDDGRGSRRGSQSQASGSPAHDGYGSGSGAASVHSGSQPASPHGRSGGSGSLEGSPKDGDIESAHGSARSSDNESPAGSPRQTDNDSPVGSPQGSGNGSPPGSPMGSNDASPQGSPAAASESRRSYMDSPMGSPDSQRESPPGSDIQSPVVSPLGNSDKGSPAASPAHTGNEGVSPPGSPAVSGQGSPAREGSERDSEPGSPAGSPRGSEGGSQRSSPARSHRSSISRGSRSPSPQKAVDGEDDEMAKGRQGSDEEGGWRKRHASGSDSGSDVDARTKKRRTFNDSEHGEKDARGSDDENVEATLGDLFGDADDISSDEERKAGEAEKGMRSKPTIDDEDGDVERDENRDEDGEGKEKEGEEGEGEEVVDEPPPETRIEVEIPRMTADLGSSLHYVKLPNFLSVETRPFDPATYEDEIEEDEVLDEEGRARTKLKVENTIRWRSVKDDEGNDVKDQFGEQLRESNARVVKWSDGSMSLHLGDEVFDIYTMPMQGSFNHLFIRQGTGLMGQSIFKSKLTFRPHSTDSFTHRKMTMSLADRSTKAQKVKVLPIYGSDPDAHRSEMIKKEEERLRASIRRDNQKRRLKERAQHRGLSSSYLEGGYEEEEDEEDGLTSISAIKRSYKEKRDKRPIYSSESDDSEGSGLDSSRAKRLTRAKRLEDSDENESESETPKKKKAARVVESDEDNDAGEEGKEGSGSASE